nr:PREDICTED: putative serine protease F56F10.1 [Bemisia tabaci]
MLIFQLVTCVFLLTSAAAFSTAQHFGLLSGHEATKRRLNDFVAKRESLQGVESKTIAQKLDHFTPSLTATWEQHYAQDFEFYDGNNLIFLMVGGDRDMDVGWLRQGFIAEQAEKFKAALFTIEHRFYGKSQPKPDLKTTSLKYLSSEQALADYAHFIETMNTEHGFKNPKWIVFGVSYGGSLAAWLRYKYPHLVYSAVSANAPLLAKVDFHEYFESVSKTLSSIGGPECAETITTANKIMSEKIVNNASQYDELFELCDPLSGSENDISSFFWNLAHRLVTDVEFMEEDEIKYACEILTDKNIADPVHRYAEFSRQTNYDFCVYAKYSDIINRWRLNKISYTEGWGARQWFYQTCTEFGWFATSSRKNNLFGDKMTVDFYDSICKDVFDVKFDTKFVENAVNKTNEKYRGLDLPVTGVIFVHGTNDPWSKVGITKFPKKGSIAIRIKGGGHYGVLLPESPNDSEQLKNARTRISKILERWTKTKSFEQEKSAIIDV